MDQMILHLLGDYVTQSDWMAQTKTKRSWPALCHALLYGLPFLLIGSLGAVAVIVVSHFAIDRWRLIRYVIWLKNHLSPRMTHDRRAAHVDVWWSSWNECRATGYHESSPAWLAVWLMIAADNTLHLAINAAALRWL